MAYRLRSRERNLLVSIHVLSVVALFGGAMSLLLLSFLLDSAQNGEQLSYALSSIRVIDFTLIRFPALAALVSGIMLAVWTPWGLVKYYWVVIKLVLTIAVVLLGILFINGWFSSLVTTAGQFESAALQRHDFQTTTTSLIVGAIFNNVAMALMIFITYFKPFGKMHK